MTKYPPGRIVKVEYENNWNMKMLLNLSITIYAPTTKSMTIGQHSFDIVLSDFFLIQMREVVSYIIKLIIASIPLIFQIRWQRYNFFL